MPDVIVISVADLRQIVADEVTKALQVAPLRTECEEVFTKQEFKAFFKIKSDSWVTKAVKEYELPFNGNGKEMRILKSEAIAWMKASKVRNFGE